jgi:hypothetical protein
MPENLQEIPMDPSIPPKSPVEAPMSDPSMMGGQPQVNPEQEAEMRFDLERMLSKIDKKNVAFEEKQALDSEKLEGLKAKIVREIFDLMRDLGIDPSDLNSINEFLQKLQQQDPDLYIMFESAIGSLSSAPGMAGIEKAPGILGAGAEAGIPGEEEGGGNLMENNTTNLQEKMLRQ